MQFWLARHRDVPIREQLVAQVVLGILSNDLPAGRRLPSTREVARRFRIHANTVSAAYQQLEREKWVEFRRGSGVYIRRRQPDSPLPIGLQLDHQIAALFRFGRKSGLTLAQIRLRLRRWLELQPPDHFLVIDPVAELRNIVSAEICGAVGFPVKAS